MNTILKLGIKNSYNPSQSEKSKENIQKNSSTNGEIEISVLLIEEFVSNVFDTDEYEKRFGCYLLNINENIDKTEIK